MAAIGIYNSQTIIAFPAKPAPKQVNLKTNDSAFTQRSPFVGSVGQVFTWPGSDYWSCEATLPRLVTANAAVWAGFLAECRGMLNVFPFGPQNYQPQGRPQGSPLVSGVNNAMATVLNTKGWKANALRVLLPGDYIQIGATPNAAGVAGVCRLHRVVTRVDADANGNATIQVWPSLREATTDGETLILKNPVGLFRMAVNTGETLSDETRLTGITLKMVEAR